jgi:hypothetical protein
MSTYDTPTTTTPQTVTVSYWLYIVGAILGIIGAIVLVVTLPAQLAATNSAVTNQLQGTSTNGVDPTSIVSGAAIGAAIFSVVLTLAYSILTVVFARKYRQGKNWARIVLAVFAALQIFGLLGGYGVGALHFLVVLAALILSFLPASNAWFRAMKPAQPVV